MPIKAPTRQRKSKGVNALVAPISTAAAERNDPDDFIDQVIQGLRPLAKKTPRRRSARDNGAVSNART